FLICLALFVAAAQAGVVAPLATYSAVAPAYSTYAAAAPYTAYATAYTGYTAAPAYSTYKSPVYSTYSAAVPSYTSTVLNTAPLAHTAPVASYSTLLKK
ncbi:hypothetical protein DOY81_008477, partial [Sarcophaga bullata]